MKYGLEFQRFNHDTQRPEDIQSSAYIDNISSSLTIPNVGDFVHLEALGGETSAHFSGQVKSRLFRYFNNETCAINIVVDTNPRDEIPWEELVKE
jgi:hypothetical protein